MIPTETIDNLDHFQRRVLQDGLTEATAIYWRRRAEVFENARPRPGEFHGAATRADLDEADARCAAMAQACRARADAADVTEWGCVA